jgi:hypothetical protein
MDTLSHIPAPAGSIFVLVTCRCLYRAYECRKHHRHRSSNRATEASRPDLEACDPREGRGDRRRLRWLCFDCADEYPRSNRPSLPLKVAAGQWRCPRCSTHGWFSDYKTQSRRQQTAKNAGAAVP